MSGAKKELSKEEQELLVRYAILRERRRSGPRAHVPSIHVTLPSPALHPEEMAHLGMPSPDVVPPSKRMGVGSSAGGGGAIKKRKLSRVAKLEEGTETIGSSMEDGSEEIKSKVRVLDERGEFVKKHWKISALQGEIENLCDPTLEFTRDSTLDEIKARLSAARSKIDPVVSQIGNETWGRHTSSIHPSGLVLRQVRSEYGLEQGSNAWLKLWEILHCFGIPCREDHKLRSLHLYEAMGSFICSLNHYIRTVVECKSGNSLTWEWFGHSTAVKGGVQATDFSTEEKFAQHTKEHWIASDGADDKLMSLDLIERIWEKVGGKKSIDFVTACGSVHSDDDPNQQELVSLPLILCELYTALGVLSANGMLVLRVFTLLERISIQLVFIVASCFEELYVVKPCTSRSSNAELYLVCLKYKGISESKLSKMGSYITNLLSSSNQSAFLSENSLLGNFSAPESFLSELRSISNECADIQVHSILKNIRLSKSMSIEDKVDLQNLRLAIADKFPKCFELKSLSPEKRIVQSVFLDGKQPYYDDFDFYGVQNTKSPSLRRVSMSDFSKSSSPSTPPRSSVPSTSYSSPLLTDSSNYRASVYNSTPSPSSSPHLSRGSFGNPDFHLDNLSNASVPFPGAVKEPMSLQALAHLVTDKMGCQLESLVSQLVPANLIDEEQLHYLKLDNYVVSWRPKYPISIMFILQGYIHILDPNSADKTPYRVSQFRIFQRRQPRVPLDKTILLGHLVVDEADNSKIHRFLIIDLLLIEGSLLWAYELNKRLLMAKVDIVQMIKKQAMEQRLRIPISFRICNMYTLDQITNVVDILPSITHPASGFEFISTPPRNISDYQPPFLLHWSSELNPIGGGISQEKLLSYLADLSKPKIVRQESDSNSVASANLSMESS